MAEKLSFTIEFDKETGAIKATQNEMDGLQKKIRQTQKTVGNVGTSFKSLTGILAKVGIANFFLGIFSSALKSTSAFEQFQNTLENVTNDLLDEFGPAIKLITQGISAFILGLKGVIVFLKTNLVGSVRGIIRLLKGDLSGAREAFAKAVRESNKQLNEDLKKAGQVSLGIVKETTSGQANIIRKTAIIATKDLKLSNEERLAIIKKAQKDIDEVVRTSSEFRKKTEGEREKARLEFQESLVGTVAALEVAIQRDAIAADKIRTDSTIKGIDARLAAVTEGIAEELSEIERGNRGKVELIDQRVEAELMAEDEAFALRQEQLERQAEEDTTRREELQAQIAAGDAEHEIQRTAILRKGTQDRRKVRLAEEKQIRAVFRSVIQAGASAAANQISQSKSLGSALRAAGAAQIRTLANQAATAITIEGAEAAAKVFAQTPGGIIPRAAAAAGTILFYSGLAATVAGVGGAVAARIAPPAAGGGGGGGEGFEAPAGGGFEPAGGTQEPLGAPPEAQGAGRSITINIVGESDLFKIDAVARKIAEEVDRIDGL